jgi:DNA polymerase III alpha subunit
MKNYIRLRSIMKFSHLHVHTQFSLLDGAAEVGKLYKKAISDGMPALAITDHGNMFGAFDFVNEAYKHKNDDGTLKVKPIVGCEFYVVKDRHIKQFTKEHKDDRFHQVLLAKNAVGYQNLIKLTSSGNLRGSLLIPEELAINGAIVFVSDDAGNDAQRFSNGIVQPAIIRGYGFAF